MLLIVLIGIAVHLSLDILTRNLGEHKLGKVAFSTLYFHSYDEGLKLWLLVVQ